MARYLLERVWVLFRIWVLFWLILGNLVAGSGLANYGLFLKRKARLALVFAVLVLGLPIFAGIIWAASRLYIAWPVSLTKQISLPASSAEPVETQTKAPDIKQISLPASSAKPVDTQTKAPDIKQISLPASSAKPVDTQTKAPDTKQISLPASRAEPVETQTTGPDLSVNTKPSNPLAPNSTPPASLMPVDPRHLLKVMNHGVTIYSSAPSEEARTKGAQYVLAAAILGYPPARWLIARNYPNSRAVRRAANATQAIRYTLEVLITRSVDREEAHRIFAAIAKHFAAQKKLNIFAQNLIEAIRQDRRLMRGGWLELIFDFLEQVPGACTAIARAVSNEKPELEKCTSDLQPRFRAYVDQLRQ